MYAYDPLCRKGRGYLEAVQVFEDKTFAQSIQRLSVHPKGNYCLQGKQEIVSKDCGEVSEQISSSSFGWNIYSGKGLRPSLKISHVPKKCIALKQRQRYFAVGFQTSQWMGLRSSIFKGNYSREEVFPYQILGKPERIKVFEGWFDFF